MRSSMMRRVATQHVLWVGVLALLLCAFETSLRLGASSPDTRFTLPRYSLGYFWDTPLGWTGLVDGTTVNKDSVQFFSLSQFFHEQAVPVPPEDNVYIRFAGYALVGSVLAPVLGPYASFVLINVLLWTAGVLATFVLAIKHTQSRVTATLAAVLVATAPAFAALAGQALPYVASFSLFVLALLLFERTGVFEGQPSLRVAAGVGLLSGLSFLFYDLFMLPAFVVVYGLLRRTSWRTLVVVLGAMIVPRAAWSVYWQLAHLPSYAHNETHPIEALYAWFDTARVGEGLLGKLKGYASLIAHGALNIAAVFMLWPLLLAGWELWQRRRSPEAAWFVAVAIGGFAPALFMLSTWPHIPRWYAYGFPAVYILCAAAAVRLGKRWPAAVALIVPALLLSNLDVLGYTKPMELLLFQPTDWSYLWSP
jgi:hypothetical protein